MSTDIREWINQIWEYCEEHWVVVLTAAVVFLLVLFSVGLARSAKREDQNAVPQEAESSSAGGDDDEEPDSDAESEFEAGSEPEAESEPGVQREADQEPLVCQDAAQDVMDSLVKSMEAAAGSSGQKVESIELKIEKAQLTIRYAGGKTETAAAEPAEEPDNPPPETAEEEATETNHTESPEECAGETDFAMEAVAVPKRFGIENMNTARSGRVYTEEELLNQIRD